MFLLFLTLHMHQEVLQKYLHLLHCHSIIQEMGSMHKRIFTTHTLQIRCAPEQQTMMWPKVGAAERAKCI
jgi:hypothetical protein